MTTTRKRFWVFAHDNYMPGGGINDLCCVADSLDEAKRIFESKQPHCGGILNYIVDTEIMSVVSTADRHWVNRTEEYPDGKWVLDPWCDCNEPIELS